MNTGKNLRNRDVSTIPSRFRHRCTETAYASTSGPDSITLSYQLWTACEQRLVKTGERLIKHARYYWLLLAESRLTRRLFGAMVRRIAALPLPSG
jgi:hypothetical protein